MILFLYEWKRSVGLKVTQCKVHQILLLLSYLCYFIVTFLDLAIFFPFISNDSVLAYTWSDL
jgi:hypothetical protein